MVQFDIDYKLLPQQYRTRHWHEHMHDDTFADAILDRLVHNSVRVELQGDTMRKQNNQIPLQQAEGKE